ncbi:hypothetical protein B0H14DRAFT_2621744 [Mycena olivaceomarginata]|nr:hypothetical protein B0H14DRAFT_2621744 [Mycena olivaceomarginata]
MADDIYPLDPTLCTNPDSPGECCGDSFDHKTAPGLCAKCYITSTNAERAEIMKDWPQCKGCSAQFKLLKAPLCGTCGREECTGAAFHAGSRRECRPSTIAALINDGDCDPICGIGILRQSSGCWG